MMNIETQMSHLRLHGMRRAWTTMIETRSHLELSLQEGLELLLQTESEERDHRRYDRLKKSAHFRYQASIEKLDYSPARGLDKSLVQRLATGEYITQGQSILITGATGCGKSFLASALGFQACHQGYSVAYFNTQKLLVRTKLSRVEGTSFKLLEKLSKTSLLILDDFGLSNMDKSQQLDLMEIIEDRHAKAATIIVSQIPIPNWFDIIDEATIADAILDRFIHTSHRIDLKGDSLRKKSVILS